MVTYRVTALWIFNHWLFQSPFRTLMYLDTFSSCTQNKFGLETNHWRSGLQVWVTEAWFHFPKHEILPLWLYKRKNRKDSWNIVRASFRSLNPINNPISSVTKSILDSFYVYLSGNIEHQIWLLKVNWKRNFPISQSIHLSVSRLVGLSVLISKKGWEVSLPCPYLRTSSNYSYQFPLLKTLKLWG